MWNTLNVKGFSFDSSEEYNDAKKEAEAIDYICAKMDVADPKIALKVYYKLLERKNLHTIIGFTFLKELRDRIIDAQLIEEKNLKPIQTTIAFSRPSKNISEYGDEEALNRDTEIASAAIDVDASIPSRINVSAPTQEELEKKREENYYINRENKLKATISDLKMSVKKCYMVIAALIIIIVAIFGISMYTGSLDFSDQEMKIQDKYAAWAEELSQKEADLLALEAELNNR